MALTKKDYKSRLIDKKIDRYLYCANYSIKTIGNTMKYCFFFCPFSYNKYCGNTILFTRN